MKIDTLPANCTTDHGRQKRIRRRVSHGYLIALSMAAWAISFAARAQDDPSIAHVEGATLRLVLTEPDAAGRVSGVLAIDLDAGWKTYWIDPGPVGLAPRFDFGESRALGPVQIAFPPPVRFVEGRDGSVGYTAPVLLPFSASVVGANPKAIVSATLGLCRDLCVPVAVRLEASALRSLSARADVLAAQRALPEPGVGGEIGLSFDGTRLTARVRDKDLASPPDLFAVPATGWTIGPPSLPATRTADGWELQWSATTAATRGDGLPDLDLVLTSGEIARSYQRIPVQPVSPADARPSSKAPEP